MKIDDTPEAHPQIGLEDADVVYIEQVEGGLTRLAALFSSVIPSHVGPVRSARISDIELLAQYGHVAFAYSGAQKKMLPVIADADLENLGAQQESADIYTRDSERNAPYNMILRADLLMSKLASKDISITSAKNPGWTFGPVPKNGKMIVSAKMNWPANSYTATWSSTDFRWLLSHHDQSDVSASGINLGPTTMVIQIVSITDSEYHDKFGGITPFSATVGSGSGFILRDGQVFDALWTRADAQSGTTWSASDGSPITFAPGQVWVALTDSAPEFTYPVASASSTPTK